MRVVIIGVYVIKEVLEEGMVTRSCDSSNSTGGLVNWNNLSGLDSWSTCLDQGSGGRNR